jgi:hypothetical protein
VAANSYDTTWLHVIIQLLEATRPRVNSHVNYGLWVLTCQPRFINRNKCSTLVHHADNMGDMGPLHVLSV